MKNSAPDALMSQHALASSAPAPTSKSASTQASILASAAASRAVGAAPAGRTAPKKTPSGASKTEAPKSETAGKAGDDAKKRVRLKPETREQLLERLRNPPLSLHETSILLRVSRATVRRYADAGRLPCLRTPGGQRRFALRDIEAFYRQLKAKR